MTTILLNKTEGVIAYDSRMLTGTEIVTDAYDKKYDLNGNPCFMAGRVSDIQQFIKEFREGDKAIRNFDCTGFLVEGGNVYHVYNDCDTLRFCKELITWDVDALGSGRKYATSALDFGLTTSCFFLSVYG